MAWELLKTDYVDAVFDGLRRYLEQQNGDGSVSFLDVTNYTVKEGSFFGAKDVNKINTAVNAILGALENGTDLYEVFTEFFDTQKELFLSESNAKQEDFEAYVTELESYMSLKWDELKTDYTEDIEQYKAVQENAFNVWFEMVRNQLTSDVAGHLQSQIGNLDELQTEDKTSLTAAVNSLKNEAKEEIEEASKIDNMSIQRDIQERLSVPALKRVFRGEIKINSASSATLYIPLKADIENMETGDDWIQEGDLFFCDVNPDGANYNCQPTTFSVIGSNEVSNTAGLYTTNCVTANANQKDNYRKVPYITYYAISSENAYDNKKGFTILRYRGIDSNKMNFQDLLNGYTNYTDIGYFDSNHSIVGALASAFAVAHAYENDMKEHKFASFGSVGTSGTIISLDYGCQYLMVLVAYNASTGAIYGTTARLITTPAVSHSTANVNVLSLGATSNTGYAITAGNYKVTVKSSSASYEVTGFLYKVLDD